MSGQSADFIIEKEGVTTYHYIHDISCSALAEKYEKEQNYEKAIEYYNKAYEEDDESYESVMQSIAHIYLKMGNPEKGIECLEKVLDCDKANERSRCLFFIYILYLYGFNKQFDRITGF